MLQKLFSLVDQTSVPDNPDSLQNQEVLLPGHIITIYLKVKTSQFIPRGCFFFCEFNFSLILDACVLLNLPCKYDACNWAPVGVIRRIYWLGFK